MTGETLKRLLLDRAVGALPEDVCELVDAYAAFEPQAAAELAAWRKTVASADRALRDASVEETQTPPFPRRRLAAAAAGRQRLAWAGRLAMAAGIVLAFLVGSEWSRIGGGSVDDSNTGPRLAARTPDREPATRDSFWALSTVRAGGSVSPANQVRGVRWDSPLKRPQITSEESEGAG
jgi:anti-sigma factor RsiW